ncbi:MAG: hypothetical protein Q4B26_09000 [Eubacteriales bacterium]|nr:hypothetical protein [Eubacteriales bacterium]
MVEFIISNMNVWIESLLGIIVIYTLLCTMLKPRRDLRLVIGMIVITFLKSVYSQGIANLAVETSKGSSIWQLSLINGLVLPILILMMQFFFFSGKPGKIALAVVISELLGSIITLGCLNIFRWLQHRENIYTAGVFRWSDLLGIPVILLIFALIYYFLRPLLLRYCSWKMRYSWGGLLLYGLYYTSTIPSYFTDRRKWGISMERYLWNFAMWTMFVLAIVYLYFRQTRRQTALEKEFLNKQNSIFEMNYILLRDRQMMEKMRLENEEMEQLLESDRGNVDSNRLKAYLHSLKQNRQRALTGIYCEDWLIDAMLVSQAKLMEQEHLQFHCETQGYRRGSIEEQDLSQVLYGFLEQVRKDAQQDRVFLEMKTVANQLLITVKWRTRQKKSKKKWSAAMKKYVRKYDGNLIMRQNGDAVEQTLCLKNS